MSRRNSGERIDIQLLQGYEWRVLNWVEPDWWLISHQILMVDNYAKHLLYMLVDDDTPTHVIESSLARVVAEHPFIIAKTPALSRVIDRLEGRL